MPDLDWITIAETRRAEVEALTEQVEGLTALVALTTTQRDAYADSIDELEQEVARLRGLLQHEHEVLTDAVERSHNLLLFARDGGVNPS